MDTKADTFPKLLMRHAEQRGERPAIREKSRGIWQTMSWRELADEVLVLAAALHESGFGRGGHLGLVGDNRPRLYAAMCAAQLLGGVAVPLYQDAVAAEMVGPLQAADVSHVFAEDQEQVDKLLEILPQCPLLATIVYDEDRGMRHYRQRELVSYEAFARKGRDVLDGLRGNLLVELQRGSGNDPAAMFFTSGTTGQAKGVVLTHKALIDRAEAAARMEGLQDTDVAVAYLPPAWIGQNMFSYAQPLVVGYTICCPESSETMLADMREIGPTYFFAPPRVLEQLVTDVTIRMEDAGALKRRLYQGALALARRVGPDVLTGKPVGLADRLKYAACDLLIYGPLRDVLGMSRLRVAYTAGEAIGADLLMFFRAIGINLKQLYGSTETSVFVCVQPNGEVKPDTVGPAVEGVEIRFTPQRELLIRSPGLFTEYWRNPEATRAAKDAEGWFHTGDAGYVGDDGHLRIIDRVKDVGQLADGSLFAPKYIENKLKFFPYIKEAVAFGAGRDQVCVFVNIDLAAVGDWADRRNISYTGYADLAGREEVGELIAGCVAKVNEDLAKEPTFAASQIARFLVLHKELDADDGELTRTRKVRRGHIGERYRVLVDALYGRQPSVRIDAEVRYEDGRTGTLSADIRIRDARTYPAPTALKQAA
jgi:long-chain acyl-CoA synthetase